MLVLMGGLVGLARGLNMLEGGSAAIVAASARFSLVDDTDASAGISLCCKVAASDGGDDSSALGSILPSLLLRLEFCSLSFSPVWGMLLLLSSDSFTACFNSIFLQLRFLFHNFTFSLKLHCCLGTVRFLRVPWQLFSMKLLNSRFIFLLLVVCVLELRSVSLNWCTRCWWQTLFCRSLLIWLSVRTFLWFFPREEIKVLVQLHVNHWNIHYTVYSVHTVYICYLLSLSAPAISSSEHLSSPYNINTNMLFYCENIQ